jgi:hypothetical protein
MGSIVRACVAAALIVAPACTDGRGAADQAADTAAGAMSGGAALVGSYNLVTRELPDGSTLEPPAIFGFMTYTNRYRHFHLFHSGADGLPTSVSFVSEYSMSGDEYSEAPLYEVLNNRTQNAGLDYNIPGTAFSSPLSRPDQGIEFRDGTNGPVLTFTGDSIIATLAGVFVDRWQRVE